MIESLSSEAREAILNAIYARRKIEAIKLVREAAGVGLKEAKEFVEKFSDDLEAKSPEKFAAKPKGCGTAVLLLTLVVMIVALTVRFVLNF